MKCEKCGYENPEHVVYCGKCGGSISERSTETTPNRSSVNAPESAIRKGIEWTPLLIVIGAAYLVSLSVSGIIGIWSNDSFELERDLSFVLSFLASASLIVAIAFTIYKKEDLGKKSLVIGAVLIICMLALRASVYLRYE